MNRLALRYCKAVGMQYEDMQYEGMQYEGMQYV